MNTSQKSLICSVLALITVGIWIPVFAADPVDPIRAELQNVQRLWSDAPHNAFTDLCRWHDHWFCAFRQAASHVNGRGTIRMLASIDGKSWWSAATVRHATLDLRDANLTVTPNDQLMLMCGAQCQNGAQRATGTFISYSDDGHQWTAPETAVPIGRWLWGVTWNDGTAWGVSYPAPNRPGVSSLLASSDGREFHTVVESLLSAAPNPTEARIRFARNSEEAVCLHRCDGPDNRAYLGVARPPFDQWRWKQLARFIGGPNLLELPSGKWVAAGRILEKDGPKTAILLLDVAAARLTPILTLPSGGDNGYPGLVWHDGLLWCSYYSSHEDRTSIYLAQIRIDETAANIGGDAEGD